jgi:hypothetical protein
MTENVSSDEARRVRSSLERLSDRAPRASEPPPGMLRRARHRVVATAIAAALAASATVLGGLELSRALISANGSTPATGNEFSAPCRFDPLPLGTLPGGSGFVQANGSGANDVWIGGYVADPSHQESRALMYHWDGSSLSQVDMPQGTPDVNSIAALSPSDAWIATLAGPEHFDGTGWSLVGNPVARGRPPQILGTLAIVASSRNDVWAVGQSPPPLTSDLHETTPLAEHFDGSAWTETPTPEGPSGQVMALWDVTSLGPDDAWAVGGDAAATQPVAPVVLHFDGKAWTAVDVPVPAGRAYVGQAVSASGSDDVWVAADAVLPNPDQTPGLLLHFDGSGWRTVSIPAAPGTAVHLSSVDAAAQGDVWIGGRSYDLQTHRSAPFIQHFDGTNWVSVPVAGSEPGAEAAVRSVRVVGDEVWAVGYSRLDGSADAANSLVPFVSVCR